MTLKNLPSSQLFRAGDYSVYQLNHLFVICDRHGIVVASYLDQELAEAYAARAALIAEYAVVHKAKSRAMRHLPFSDEVL